MLPSDKKDERFIESLCHTLRKDNIIPPEYYDQYNVKRGLRNTDGTGVVAGCTHVCNVHGYLLNEGERIPHDGELTYRGYNVEDLIRGFQKADRFGFEDTAFLLLFGHLPSKEELQKFNDLLWEFIELPYGFVEDMIMKAPSPDIMNKLACGVLALYGYDEQAGNTDIENVVMQSISLISRMPSIAVAAYQVKKRYYDKRSLYFHFPQKGQSMAESILYMLRSDKKFTDAEAKLLDLCLILHMEHGGGNNSTFTTRVLTSSGTDTYSAIAGAICSLKGPKHGGANAQVVNMLEEIKANVKNWKDEDEVREYLRKIVRKEAGDGSGLIYGMGHAIYTLSDPRAVQLKKSARDLALIKDMIDEFELIEAVERLTPEVFCEIKGDRKAMCANVDLYSGFVYRMLGIPEELNTPLFAAARVVGWCAHRLEELMTGNRIIRPAYKAIEGRHDYVPIGDRD